MTRRRFKTPYARRLQVRKANRRWQASPAGAYSQQRLNAEKRGIEWQFTFESWWAMWERSGKWELRGRHGGCYCMARLGDTGPYAPFNCVIVTWEANAQGTLLTAGLQEQRCLPLVPGADVYL